MWVNSKEAAAILGVKYDALQKATRRAEKCGKKICSIKFHKLYFSYIEGRGGASGKILQIWIDDEIINQSKSNINEKEGFEGEIIETSANAERDACFEEFRREIQPADVHALKDSESVKAISAATESIGSLNFMQNELSEVFTQALRSWKKEGKNANIRDRENAGSRIGKNSGARSNRDSQTVKIPAFCKEYEQKGLCGQDSRSRGVWMESERSLDGHTIHNLYDDNSASGNLLLNEAKYKGENIDETDKKNVVNICSHSDTISDNMCSTDSKGELWAPKVRGVVWQTGRMGGEIDNDDSDGFVSSGNDSGNHAVVYGAGGVNLPAIATCSDKKRKAAFEKYEVVKEWERAKGKIKEAAFIDYINAKKVCSIKVTANKLYDWQRKYRQGGLDGLVDERTNNKKLLLEELGLKELCVELILSCKGKGKVDITDIYKSLNYHVITTRNSDLDLYKFHGRKDEAISYEAVNRFVNNYLNDNKLVKNIILYGEDGAVGRQMPSLGVSNWAVDSINQIVEIDASPLDLICNASDICDIIGYSTVNNIFKDKEEFETYVKEWQKRYTIIALIDTYSGVATFHISDTENSIGIARAVAKYILRYGKPAVIKGDNGKAFKSEHISSVMNALEIEYRAVRAYSGWLKPYVERNFRALQHSFTANLAGFIGHNITQRQAIEFFYSKKERRLKKGYKTNLKELKNLNEVQELMDMYAEKFLNTRYLERLEMCVCDAYNQKAHEAIAMDVLSLSARLSKSAKKHVNKNGISIDNVWFYSIDMFDYERVVVRKNIDNTNECFLWNESGQFIGVARTKDLESGVKAEEAKSSQKLFNKRLKETKNKMSEARVKHQVEFVDTVRQIEAPKTLSPQAKGVNNEDKEIRVALKKSRNLINNPELSDEYMQYATKSQSKPKIKGFEEMAEAKRKAI